MHNTTSTKNPSVLASLRSLVPDHEIGFQHVLRIAERQAGELLRRFGQADGPTPSDIITRFSRIKVINRDTLTTSGASRWNGSQWVIFLRRTDPHVRQRFTMCHELAHVIHHNSLDAHIDGRRYLTDQPDAANAKRQRERAADHFAGCLLMPRERMLTLWANGIRRPGDFAIHFDVSASAAQVRLEHLGLVQPRWQCTRGLNAESYDPRPTSTMRALGLRQPRRTRTHASRTFTPTRRFA